MKKVILSAGTFIIFLFSFKNKRTVGILFIYIYFSLFLIECVVSASWLTDYFKFHIFLDDWRPACYFRCNWEEEKIKRINEKYFLGWKFKMVENGAAAKNRKNRPRNRFTSLFVSLSVLHSALVPLPISLVMVAAFILILSSILYIFLLLLLCCYAFYSWHFIIYGAEILDWCNLVLWYNTEIV